jgi:hypothetical protein
MSSANLMRLGGLAAIIAGVLRVFNTFVPSETPMVVLEILYLLTDLSILFGLMGLYGFQHQESGLWGFCGFLLATTGTGIIIGPDGAIAGVNTYTIGTSLLAAGLILLAVGSWIANKLPRWLPSCWLLSTIAGVLGYAIPSLNLLFAISGVIFGIGFAGAGIKVWLSTTVQPEY